MLFADRGFDADSIRALVSRHGAWANIPPKRKPDGANLFQPPPLPCSELGRAVLQQDQAVSSGRYALWQAGRQL